MDQLVRLVDGEAFLRLFLHFGPQRFLRPLRVRLRAVVLPDLAFHLDPLHPDPRIIVNQRRIDPPVSVVVQVQIAAVLRLRHRHHAGHQAVAADVPVHAQHVLPVPQPESPVRVCLPHHEHVPVIPPVHRAERAHDALVRVQDRVCRVPALDLACVRAVLRADQVRRDGPLVVYHESLLDPRQGHSRALLMDVRVLHQHAVHVVAHVLRRRRYLVVFHVHGHQLHPEQLFLDHPRLCFLRCQVPDIFDLAGLDVSLQPVGRAHLVPSAVRPFHVVEVRPAFHVHQHRRSAGAVRDLRPLAQASGVRVDLVPGQRLVQLVVLPAAGYLAPHGVAGPRHPCGVHNGRRLARSAPERRARGRPVQVHVHPAVGRFDGFLRHRCPDNRLRHDVHPFPVRVDRMDQRQVIRPRRLLDMAALQRHEHRVPVSAEVRIVRVKYTNHRNRSLRHTVTVAQPLPETVFAPGSSTGKSPTLFAVRSVCLSAVMTIATSLRIRYAFPSVSPVMASDFPPALISALVPVAVNDHSGFSSTSPLFIIFAFGAMSVVLFCSSSLNGWQ